MRDIIRVTAIQRLCVNDGPGVRTVVFLKGCYLECPWCCNPEAIHFDRDLYFDKGSCKCSSENNICNRCEFHGGDLKKEHCPFGSFEKTYTDYYPDELYELLLRDENLYQDGGGITFSGGEPLLQAFAIKSLLQLLHKRNIHIAFETSLYAPIEQYNSVKEYVDYWLVDLKLQFGYITNKDYNISEHSYETNFHDLQLSGKKIKYRMVVMEEMMNNSSYILQKINALYIRKMEFLNYHGLAENKYKELNRRFRQFHPLSPQQWLCFSECLCQSGIEGVLLQL